jgi:hypothetical protein
VNSKHSNAWRCCKNNSELYQIKPTIRLVKYWNANAGYVYDTFLMEKYIISVFFFGCANIRDYLFNVFDNLHLSYDQPQWRKDKLARAKEIVANVRKLEADGMPSSAELEVRKLIPL